MKGKYSSWPHFLAAFAVRQLIRHRLRNALSWSPPQEAEDGCTAIIAMCHRLPDILLGNLRCLHRGRWPALREVIIVVDGVNGCLPVNLERDARAACGTLQVTFYYYNEMQARLTERLRLPYVFSWLSWSIGLSHVRTRVALLHDYDALILDGALGDRYDRFVRANSAIQGVRWYDINGVVPEDKLATTFEAFVDVAWLRQFRPIDLFNQIGVVDGVSRDYDNLLEIQHRHTPVARRAIMPMGESSLVHPSQMIHQYTMFRKCPGAPLACFSIPMIPFFYWLSGKADAFTESTARLGAASGRTLDFFADGTSVNFTRLDVDTVTWLLKQMVQVCLSQGIPPSSDLYQYGRALYRLVGAHSDQTWHNFPREHRDWIDQAERSATNAIRLSRTEDHATANSY